MLLGDEKATGGFAMIRTVLVMVLMMGTASCSTGCEGLGGAPGASSAVSAGSSVEVSIADAIGVVVNAATPLLVQAAEEDEPGPATDLKWEKIEAAHDALRVAHTTYVAALERGERPTAANVIDAYCEFWTNVPESVKEDLAIPSADVLCQKDGGAK